ncbi:retrovirus-related Pol polyprotein from transposon 17.6 [Trichonephila clavata]|uniref:Retrovirus-related Pol polyprotein from transposon 17.6 n=1 Tax=Trichonephila clavata TaxID=2740835 RepID=A0A8X6LK43_TRICU|nr:retrovirus-related Pol polyprotein from transposon 17.6 [Trichonephila clavata]
MTREIRQHQLEMMKLDCKMGHVFVEEQHKSEPSKPLIAEAKINVSKERYIFEKKCIVLQEKRDKTGTERKRFIYDSTSFGPTELVHGRNLSTPMMLLYENLTKQCEENEEHPIMFLSKKLSLAEQKYRTTEKECAAINFAVQNLKCYPERYQEFFIQINGNPLVWLEKNTGTNPRLLRWGLILQSFKYEIAYLKGKQSRNADSLSHIPLAKTHL